MVRLIGKLLLYALPKRTYTGFVGAFANMSLSRHLIPWYVRHYEIDTADAELDPQDYRSLGEFFCRRLRPGSRPITDRGIASPVDGIVSEFGPIADGVLVQAKGVTYTLKALLGSHEDARNYEGGWYVTLYLSPRDYHRIHMPCDGRVVFWRHIPGTLFPVNAHGVRSIPGLFTKNERIVTVIETDDGDRVALVKVGAAGVGSVRTPYVEPAQGHTRHDCIREGHASVSLRRGEEVGWFEFGSTVILLLPKGFIQALAIERNQFVRMGERLDQDRA